ncbi:DUF4097 family beta strand repeat-containing protein [Streptococcus thermophilus]|uniref:DUF4097 family beta strand repeat-containing protein n=1 Tax=Streptococcus thermophilus TaxID=1308 RepID=UPI0022FE5E0A|nr:DUF4097 family beta strand repeat-containing protein [Streptococcus thermophilus]MDA5509845.1 DUF4097 family beta strand repeat-containing protein [Streptococcus thermophilus]MDA5540006.1 DUF4097 family beta strand repeat-containing protein [Streptococcus thermophilus]MDA5551409.1 DUF4097 family beta strand repeat-containing protein [Streptococcus thermophilus]
MKTWKKIVHEVSLISLFLGGGLATWVYSQGGLTDLQNQNKSELDYVKKEVDNFNKIDIKSSSYNVLIQSSEVNKATLSYYQKIKNTIDTTVKDGQLTINDNNSKLDSTSKKHINFFELKDLIILSSAIDQEVRKQTIIITLPKKQTIDFLKVDLATGNLDLSHSTVRQVDINLNMVNLNFNKMIVSNLKANLDVGSVDSDNTLFTNADLSIAMGEYSGNNLIFNGHNKLDVTTGEVEIALKDYTINVQADSHSGEVDVTNNLKNSKDNTLTITSDLGNITVE